MQNIECNECAEGYRTGSGPGSPAGQPRWGGGSDRVKMRLLKLWQELDFRFAGVTRLPPLGSISGLVRLLFLKLNRYLPDAPGAQPWQKVAGDLQAH